MHRPVFILIRRALLYYMKNSLGVTNYKGELFCLLKEDEKVFFELFRHVKRVARVFETANLHSMTNCHLDGLFHTKVDNPLPAVHKM